LKNSLTQTKENPTKQIFMLLYTTQEQPYLVCWYKISKHTVRASKTVESLLKKTKPFSGNQQKLKTLVSQVFFKSF